MKKMLLFAPFFVPRKRVGALRPYKFVTHLKDLGWEPSVISFDTKGETLSAEEIKNIGATQIVEMRLPFDRTQKKSSSDISSSSKSSQKKASKSWFSFDFAGFLDSLIAIDTWLPFIRRNNPLFEKVIEEQQPDVLWTTADPWSGLVVCKQLKEKYNLPWIVDMRDPWTLCTNRYKKKKAFLKKKEQPIEREILNSADAVVFTSRETYHTYSNFYTDFSDKFHVIHNGFLVSETSDTDFASPFPDETESAKLLFYGKFRDSSPAYVLIPTLLYLKEHFPDTFKKIRMYHVGDLDSHDAELIGKAALTSHFVALAATPYEQAQLVLSQADLLVSVLNPNRNQVIPTKFWDYLAAKKTIISFGKNAELKDILQETGLGDQFSMDDAEQAAKYIHNHLSINSANHKSALESSLRLVDAYSSRAITQKLVAITEKISVSRT